MKMYGQAQQAANRILTIFQHPELLPAAVAPVFIELKIDKPCNAWSFRNRILTALAGTSDARGFQQWKEVGRKVKKGAKAFHILAPCTGTREDETTGDKKSFVYGFRAIPVFRLEDTEGTPLEAQDPQLLEWMQSLPLVDVAHAWGLNVSTFNGSPGLPEAKYRRGKAIALGVKNAPTFFHELMHAADDRLGNMVERGQHWKSETVAEFGAAVLCECLGIDETSANFRGAYEYLQGYAKAAEKTVDQAAIECLDRICQAVTLILETAEKNALPVEEVARLAQAA